MKRLVIAAIIALGVTLLLAASLVSWLAATDSGLRFVWSQVERFLPADVELTALSGRLIGPVVVTGLEVTTGTVRITLERAELDWQPLALLDRAVNVDRVELRGLDVVLIPTPPDAVPADQPFELPQSLVLPVDLNVETAELDGMRVFAMEGEEPLVVDSAAFSLHFDEDELLFHELVVRAPLFDVDGRVNITPRGNYASEAELDWVLRPSGYPPASATTLMFGDQRELTVRQTIGPPYALDAQFVVRRPFTELTLGGSVSLRVEPAELGLDLPLERVVADISFEGGLEDLTLAGGMDLTAPAFVDTRIDFEGTYTGDAVAVESLRVEDAGSAAALQLAGRAELDGAEPVVDLMGEWVALQWPLRGDPLFSSESGSLRLAGTPRDLLAELAADAGGGGSIEGSVRRREEQLAVDLAWRNLEWPQGMPQVSSDRGRLTVDGMLDAYRMTLDAALEVATGAAGHVRAVGNGSTAELDLERIDVAVLDGTLTGRGAFSWDPVVTGSILLEGDNLDPGTLSEDWSGRVGGRIDAAAATDANGLLSVRLETLTLEGELRERALELDASGRYAADSIVIDALALRSGGTAVDASGMLGPDLDFNWTIESPDLSDLWPGIAGRLTARGSASGPRARPIVSIDAQGSGLELEAFEAEIAEVSVTGQVDTAGLVDSELALVLADARVLSREIRQLDLNASGDAAAHTLTLAAVEEDVDVRFALNGSLEEPWQPDFSWNFQLERAALGYAAFEPWTLREPSSGFVTGNGMELDRTCWQSGRAELCAAAMREQEGTSARFTLTALPFQYFSTLFPEDARMTGTLDAAGDFVFAPDAPPRMDINLTTSPGRIGSVATGGGIAGLAFGRAAADLTWDGESLVTRLEWPFERQQGRLELHATITQPEGEPFTDSAVDGSVIIEANNLAFLSDLVIGVESTAGSVSGDIGVSGTVAAPRLIGRLQLADGAARLRGPGIVLENMRLALVGDGRGEIAVEGELTSGGGRIETEGRLSLEEALPVGLIRVRGEDFELFNTPDARVFVSPDLRLELTTERLELTGDVVVPQAQLTPRAATEGAIPVSEDQVFVDAEEEARSSLTRPFYAQVELSLGEAVSFEGFGLTGDLAGALEIVEVPAEPTTGSGELRIEEGTYEAYGQELEIRTGRLLFAGGALARPGLDIEAVRRPAEDILVGARVRGTLNRPELSVFSEPPMPEQEQLSYLVLGRPLEGASASETSAMSQAAMALGLRGGNFVSERLNETLGFDEFGIQTQSGEAASAASFVIGKYLSPSLYVSYGVGLFEPVNTLRLRYTISSRWRLVTETSSAGSGGDLIYHIERGD